MQHFLDSPPKAMYFYLCFHNSLFILWNQKVKHSVLLQQEEINGSPKIPSITKSKQLKFHLEVLWL